MRLRNASNTVCPVAKQNTETLDFVAFVDSTFPTVTSFLDSVTDRCTNGATDKGLPKGDSSVSAPRNAACGGGGGGLGRGDSGVAATDQHLVRLPCSAQHGFTRHSQPFASSVALHGLFVRGGRMTAFGYIPSCGILAGTRHSVFANYSSRGLPHCSRPASRRICLVVLVPDAFRSKSTALLPPRQNERHP